MGFRTPTTVGRIAALAALLAASLLYLVRPGTYALWVDLLVCADGGLMAAALVMLVAARHRR